MSPQTKRIQIDPPNGFLLDDPAAATGAESVFVRWDDVSEIQTFKLDLFGYDMIVFGFYELHRNRFTEVGEDVVGWKELCEIIREIYPVIPKDWEHEVAFPAFQPNLRTLFKRSSDSK